MTKYYDIIRVNIRNYRKQKKLTQRKLAEMADMSEDYLCEIESIKKQKTFSIEVLGRIAEALQIDIKDFFNN